MLFVSYGNVDSVPSDPDGLGLSEYRLDRLAKLQPAEKRRQSIGAELLLVKELSAVGEAFPVPLHIGSGTNGKPCLLDSTIHFNLSHSGHFAACAVSDAPVGLDIQVISPCRDAVLRRCFCLDEQEYVRSSTDPDEAFTEVWTKKESYLKALGLGLRKAMDSFSVLDLPDGASVWHTALEGMHISVCSLIGSAIPDTLTKRKLP